MRPLRHLDLFSGIGGFALGLRWAGGFKTVAFCEIDPFCQGVLEKHWPDVPIHSDIKELTADAVGPVDIVTGGFPCQDVSLAGKRAGLDGRRSGLWSEFARLAGEIRPRYIIVENTPGLLSLGMGRILGDLAALGYNAEWDSFPTALPFGHNRERVWIVAYDVREGLPQWSGAKQNGGNGSYFFPRERFAGLLESAVPRKKWSDQSLLGRGVSRIPGRVDRIRALGNAVVPQIPQAIGEAILEAHWHDQT